MALVIIETKELRNDALILPHFGQGQLLGCSKREGDLRVSVPLW
jgi:hypothetical protein